MLTEEGPEEHCQKGTTGLTERSCASCEGGGDRIWKKLLSAVVNYNSFHVKDTVLSCKISCTVPETSRMLEGL